VADAVRPREWDHKSEAARVTLAGCCAQAEEQALYLRTENGRLQSSEQMVQPPPRCALTLLAVRTSLRLLCAPRCALTLLAVLSLSSLRALRCARCALLAVLAVRSLLRSPLCAPRCALLAALPVVRSSLCSHSPRCAHFAVLAVRSSLCSLCLYACLACMYGCMPVGLECSRAATVSVG
jgi:hypothetical protein